MSLSASENYLIKLLRELKPYERIEITKDKDGKPDRYIVQREQKIIVNELTITSLQ
jgi:hypothetical protein